MREVWGRGVSRNGQGRGFGGQKLSKEGVLWVRKYYGYAVLLRVLAKMTKQFEPKGGGF